MAARHFEPLEPRILLNGLTIITHGAELFEGLGSTSRPGWITDMGNAIAKRLGGNTPIYTIRVEPGSGTGAVGGVKVTGFSHLSGAATSADSTSGQTILLLDWAAASNVDLLTLSADHSAASIASVVMPYLTTALPAAGITAPLAEGAIQLIGHSRGGSIVSELAKDLGQVGLWVDQVTTLDPRPVSPDPSVSLKSNVIFADNYYQTSGDGILTPNGMPISSATNLGPLSVPGGYGSTHQNIPLFYQGTIDLGAGASLEGNTVPDSWYAGNNVSRSASGFYYTLLGGGASQRPPSAIGSAFGGTATRALAPRSGSQWADIGMLVPSTGVLGASQSFAASYRYNTAGSTASLQWFLDPDSNPYNNNSIALGDAQVLAATGEPILQGVANLVTANVGLGNYYLEARISNTVGTRYAYSAALAVNSSNAAPIGSLDTAGPAALQGWVVDPDSTRTALSIRVDIDGATFVTTAANLTRSDLVKSLGSANHGFSVDLTPLSTGTHRMDLFALDAATGNPTLIASRTLSTNRAPIGSIDWFNLVGGAGGGQLGLAGWAFDADAPSTSIQVRYSIDNNAPGFLPTNQDRPDVGAVVGSSTHGYAVLLPQLTAGSHSVSVYAVDPLSQALTSLGTRNILVAAPGGNATPTGSLDVAANNLLAGWAYDPSAPGTSIYVRLDVDGVGGTPFVANIARPDLASIPGGPAYAFFTSPMLSSGPHKIDLYAYDTTSAAPVLLASRIFGAALVAGSLDTLSAGQITGWAYASPVAAASSAVFRIDIDNLPGPALFTSTARGDITALYTPGTWGYTLATPSLSAGTHNVTLYVIDPLTLTATPIVTRALVVG